MSTGHKHPDFAGTHSSTLCTRLLKDPEVRRFLHRYEGVDDSCNLPYLAGYSKGRKTIYIDRHLPEVLSYHHNGRTREYRPRSFLIEPQIVKKAVIDALKWKYAHAHQGATEYKRRHVMQAGLLWNALSGCLPALHQGQTSTEAKKGAR